MPASTLQMQHHTLSALPISGPFASAEGNPAISASHKLLPPPPEQQFCTQCKAQREGCCQDQVQVQQVVPCMDATCHSSTDCTEDCTIVECDQDVCFEQPCQTVWCAQPQCEPWNGAWFCDACPKQVTCCDGQSNCCTADTCFAPLPFSLQAELDMPPSQRRQPPLLPNQQYFQALASAYPGMVPPPMGMFPPHPPHPHFMHNMMAGPSGPFSGPGSNTPSLASTMSLQNSPTPPSFGSDPWCCQWANCNFSFGTLEELKEHVDSQHLHLPGVHCAHLAPPPRAPAHPHQHHHGFPHPLSLFSIEQMQATECLWGNCGEELPPDFEPGTIESALAMAEHLLQDHLNIDTNGIPGMDVDPSLGHHIPPPNFHNMISPTSGPPTFPNHNTSRASSSSTEEHACEWDGCNAVFDSAGDLMQHLSAFHVGSGKNEYWCRWHGCDRNSEGRAFASKQKILRHVQSHTGYRPYECEICHQFFSEPATLQQHKRRHTNERPFLCDYPGCGKAFAIAGALTIHKRTHNGEKPFKCTYCDRAFSESSNYTKHLRTHTGSKPYLCPESGCGKRFSRPDQLSRHSQTHKLPMHARMAVEESDDDGE